MKWEQFCWLVAFIYASQHMSRSSAEWIVAVFIVAAIVFAWRGK
jgi:hypothetical protein